MIDNDEIFLRFERRLRECVRRANLPGKLTLTYWRPDSNRKHRIRQFIIASLDASPAFIAKIRTEREDDKVGRERQIMLVLASELKGQCLEPLDGDVDGFVMRYVGECNLPAAFGPATEADRLRIADAAVAALIAFHRTGGYKGSLTAAQCDALLGTWRPEDQVTQQAFANAPIGPMHGDSGAWNFQCDRFGRGMTMIDWEDYRSSGLPTLDVLNALLTLTLLVHPDHLAMPPEQLYRATFIDPGPMTSILRRGLLAYCSALQLSPSACLALVPVYCRNMLNRFDLENRPTAHLFYWPILRNFRLDDTLWLCAS